jgi:MFS family permease
LWTTGTNRTDAPAPSGRHLGVAGPDGEAYPPPTPPPPPSQWTPPTPWSPPPYQGYGWAPPPLPKAGDERTGPLPLHPMTLSDILDGAFKLYKANVVTILIIAGAFIVPVNLISAFLQRDTFGGKSIFDAINDPNSIDTTNDNRIITSLIVTLVGIVLAPLIAGAVSRVVSASYLGQREPPGSALIVTLKRSWALLIAFVLVHIMEVFGFALCIFPGICVMTMFVSVAPAIVVERLGPLRGMARSWRLSAARFWPVMGIALLSGLLASMLGNILVTPFTFAAFAIGYHWGWILIALSTIVASLITQPFVAIVATLIYFDLRIRKEGFDLEMIAAALARRDQRGDGLSA